MPIPEINVDQVGIPDIPKWLTSSPPQAIPIYPPVTQQIGVPIIDIPGCVEAHEQQDAKNQNIRRQCILNALHFQPSLLPQMLRILNA